MAHGAPAKQFREKRAQIQTYIEMRGWEPSMFVTADCEGHPTVRTKGIPAASRPVIVIDYHQRPLVDMKNLHRSGGAVRATTY